MAAGDGERWLEDGEAVKRRALVSVPSTAWGFDGGMANWWPPFCHPLASTAILDLGTGYSSLRPVHVGSILWNICWPSTDFIITFLSSAFLTGHGRGHEETGSRLPLPNFQACRGCSRRRRSYRTLWRWACWFIHQMHMMSTGRVQGGVRIPMQRTSPATNRNTINIPT